MQSKIENLNIYASPKPLLGIQLMEISATPYSEMCILFIGELFIIWKKYKMDTFMQL